MSEDKLTYEDIKQYEFLLAKAPSLLLGTMIRTNANLISKFESFITPRLQSLNEIHRKRLDMVLNSDVSEIQALLADAYQKSGKKQYKQLSEPKATKFIEKNIAELKKLL